jgi:hypothetical protein
MECLTLPQKAPRIPEAPLGPSGPVLGVFQRRGPFARRKRGKPFRRIGVSGYRFAASRVAHDVAGLVLDGPPRVGPSHRPPAGAERSSALEQVCSSAKATDSAYLATIFVGIF